METLSRSHLHVQGGIKKAIAFGPSNHGRGRPTVNKVSDYHVSIRRSEERVGIRMCMDSAPKLDGDSQNFSPRNYSSIGKIEGINYSRVPSVEQQHEEDWRTFRARLVSANSSVVSSHMQRPRNLKSAEWAHEIENIEEGCVLVATDELKRHPLLSEAVVLVLKWPENSSTCKGIVLNKVLPYDVSSMDIVDPMLRNLRLPAFMGGPAVGGSGFGSRFHVLTREKGVAGFESIMPGLYGGNKGVSLQSAMRSEGGMRLYLGEVELEKRHLRAQVKAFGWWRLVACSRDVVFSTAFSTDHMWCHINHLLTT